MTLQEKAINVINCKSFLMKHNFSAMMDTNKKWGDVLIGDGDYKLIN